MRMPRNLKSFVWLLFAFGCSQGRGEAGLRCISSEDIDPLENQPRYGPYTENTFFADTRAMRPPPEGAVPREIVPRTSPFATGGTPDGGLLDTIPLPISAELLREGRTQFEITCAACHGLLGDGASVVASQMALRPPPSLLSDKVRSFPVGRIFRVATEGYGFMPGYRDQIPDRLRWAVVAYVRALELSQSAPLSTAPNDAQKRLRETP